MAYKVGERVIYGNYGVCEITKIEERPDFIDPSTITTYYTLKSLNDRMGKAMIPANRMDQVRYALTRKEARELIDNVPAIEIDDFFDEGRNVTEDHFAALLKTGELENLITVIKSMHVRIAKQTEMGKNPSAAYVRLEKDAKAKLYTELAFALNIEKSDVEDYITKVLEGNNPQQ